MLGTEIGHGAYFQEMYILIEEPRYRFQSPRISDSVQLNDSWVL